MIEYTIAVLQAIVDMISQPPLFYIFGLIVCSFAVNIVLIFMGRK